MDIKDIEQIRFQLMEIAKGFNGYNGEVLLDGIKTRLEMSKAIEVDHPQNGKITPEHAQELMQIATNVFKNERLSQ